MTGSRIGLRGRLALSFAAIVVAAFAVAFVAVYETTGSQLRSRIDRDLATESDAIAARLQQAGGSPAAAATAARDYLRGRPFGPSARLLIVDVPGAGTITNEPELVGPRLEPGEARADAREELRQAALLRRPAPGLSDVRLSDAGSVRMLTRTLPGPRGPVTIQVGEPLQSVSRAQAEIAKTFLIAGALTLVAALLAAIVVAARTAAPLRRMARIAAAVDAGELSLRIGGRGPRDEVRMLAESFDHMLDRLESAFSRQRQFVSDASHELRTPLTVIRGQLEVLALEPDPSAERVAEVERKAVNEVRRIQRLVEDLLTLARLDEGVVPRPADVPLEPFVKETAAAVDGASRIDVEPVVQGTLRADSDQIAQVIRNLLRNAVDHTPPGGRVRMGAEARDGTVRIYVDDEGDGIPVGERDRVFDRFHRVEAARDRRSGGSGLGLAIARSIVEAHGGRIWAEDSPLGGARIAFELPGFRSSTA